MIFVNRDKIKNVNSKKTKPTIAHDVQSCQVINSQRNLTKVYINPNFKNVVKSKKEIPLEEHYHMRRSGSNLHQSTSHTLPEVEKLLETIQPNSQKAKQSNDTSLQNSVLPKEKTSSVKINRSKIFFNPQFQRLTDNAQNLDYQQVKTVKPSGSFQTEKTKFSNFKTSLNKNVHGSILSNDDLSKKVNAALVSKQQDPTVGRQRTASSSVKKKQIGKVYINPQFRSRQPNRSNLIVIPTETRSVPEPHSQTPNGNQVIVHPGNSGKEQATLSTPKLGTTSSVCVDSKRTRRRKSSASFVESGNRSDPRKLLFVSKTKLVRNSVKYSINAAKNPSTDTRLQQNASAKSPLKSPNSFYVVSRHKITKKRKRSLSSSSNSLRASSTGKSPLIKIRSKNGKSLKIVRSNQKSTLSLSESGNQKRPLKGKDIPNLKNRKNLVLQRKNQFSKVNVTLNKSVLVTKSRYVYKKKNLAVKKSISSIILKNRNIDTSKLGSITDKVNFIKSKYRLIRKNCLNNATKRSSRNEKFAQGSKRWKNPKHIPSKEAFKRHPKHLSIVNIGGVFYQCSRNSLTKNKASIKNVLLKNKSTVLQISGKRFKLENNGHTLKCLDKKPGRKRIDIGGITFISSSSGKSLTRTNYHTARSIILQARQKRIAQLTRKLRKNNEHCPFFHRFGKCSGKEQGTCTRQHDPKYVTVCKKFVQGACSDANCLLSHQISPHNLPTCQHFLAGQCGRDNCPYPHVKVSDDVAICVDFLKGFCVLGALCAKRHFEICPAFEKGSCSRGKYCPYPHPKSKTAKPVKRNQIKRKLAAKPAAEVVSNANVRYFEDASMKKENDVKLEKDEKEEENLPSDEERIHPKRPRLGRLPSFIPLSFDKSFSEYSQE